MCLAPWGWGVPDSCSHIIGDPLNKIAAVFVWDIKHLLGPILLGHMVPDGGSPGQVTARVRVTGGHCVLGTHHLWGELGHRQDPGYCWLAWLAKGAKRGMKKGRRGQGTALAASLPGSASSWLAERGQVVFPFMLADARRVRAPGWAWSV